MKFMKKLTIIMALLLVSIAFVGVASAATASYTDVTITPSTSVVPEQTITANFKINLPAKTVSDSDYIYFGSDLTTAVWNIQVMKGGIAASPMKGTSTSNLPFKASTFTFYYGDDTDVTLIVSMSGKVSAVSAGKSINAVKITSSNPNVLAYTSPAQKVYNPSNVNVDVSRVNSDISAVEARITAYSALGIDTAAASSQIASAKTKASAAASSVGNPMTAYANIEAADKYITETERSLALAGLKAANTNIGTITSIATTLTERGWNTEALYLKSEANLLASEQKNLATQYNTGANPDTAAIDKLVKDSYALLEQANKYLEDSAGLPILKILPFVIIGVVAVAAVAGIVVLILRRRSNRGDELG